MDAGSIARLAYLEARFNVQIHDAVLSGKDEDVDADLVALVQYHERPFALRRRQRQPGSYSRKRFDRLLSSISDWNLFLAFCLIDGSTKGKSGAPVKWLLGEAEVSVESRYTAADTT